ncbi:MAG: acyl-CoA thioesterase [Rikenellaceae bacterium]|nr:acyl-CoA thioesterase [Rikenellaceae bacterium]MCL2692883.1 acyl-CoA thioesterase [Rikenellaceae bacterium]
MLSYEIPIRVRYKETDAMGVVHHSNYVNFYEVARTEMLREHGTTYKELEESGVMLPVHEVEMRFYAPARYDDLLTVRLTMRELPGVRMTFDHEIVNQEGVVVNTGRVVLVFMSAVTRRACRAPQWFLDIFRGYL